MSYVDTSEVVAPALPNWKDLTYEQIDKYFGECVYREVVSTVNAKVSPAALDLLISNLQSMAEQLQVIRDRVGSA